MKILVVGAGAREHALAWKLSQEAEVIAAPGNPGIEECARCIALRTSDHGGLVDLAHREAVDLVVVGPEDPLIAGLADAFRDAGVLVFGPGRDGAKLEASKTYSKELMERAGVPTAAHASFQDLDAARSYIRSTRAPLVVKASGAALGKGVIVCDNEAQALEAVESMLGDQDFGEAGSTVVVEERLEGFEFSLMTLCSDAGIWSLPVAQDYKRALDGNRGPNTGGMGSFSPVGAITRDLVVETEDRVVRPILNSLKQKGIAYRGVLFSGMMMTERGLMCLEFNVRFGDPETQSLVLRLGGGFAAALLACAKGEMIPPVEVLNNVAVTVVLASGGYPGPYEKDRPIHVGPLPDGARLFHAGTGRKGGGLVTTGGRVINVSATAPTLAHARALAYEAASGVDFEGKQLRLDIAG